MYKWKWARFAVRCCFLFCFFFSTLFYLFVILLFFHYSLLLFIYIDEMERSVWSTYLVWKESETEWSNVRQKQWWNLHNFHVFFHWIALLLFFLLVFVSVSFSFPCAWNLISFTAVQFKFDLFLIWAWSFSLLHIYSQSYGGRGCNHTHLIRLECRNAIVIKTTVTIYI